MVRIARILRDYSDAGGLNTLHRCGASSMAERS